MTIPKLAFTRPARGHHHQVVGLTAMHDADVLGGWSCALARNMVDGALLDFLVGVDLLGVEAYLFRQSFWRLLGKC